MKPDSVLFEIITEAEGNPNPDSNAIADQDSTLGSVLILRSDVLTTLRAGPMPEVKDNDAAEELLDLAQDELTAYATHGDTRLNEDEIKEVIRALKAVLRRLGINLPLDFRNYATFRSAWITRGMVGSGAWEKRRQYLEESFKAARDNVELLQDEELSRKLEIPANIRRHRNWAALDQELRELKRSFERARTIQDFRGVGTNCIGVLEQLGEMLYDPETMSDESPEPIDRFKARLEAFVNLKTPGSENREIRAAIRATSNIVQKLKHEYTNPVFMGIAAEATLSLVTMLRRIDEQGALEDILDNEPF